MPHPLVLLALLAVAAVAAPAHADEPPPPAPFAAPDLDAETAARLRLGFATLEHVSGTDIKDRAVLLAAVRASHAPHPDLELSITASSAMLYSTNRDGIIGSGVDGGFGLPAFGIEWSRPLAARWRIGAGALAAVGVRTPEDYEDPYPSDVAAGAFTIDPSIVWTRAHMGLVHGGAAWSDRRTTVHGDLGLQGYTGGALSETVSVLRLAAGLTTRVAPRWTAGLEALVQSDAHHEALMDDTDLVPSGTLSLRRHGRTELGFAISHTWLFSDESVPQAGLVALVDLVRRF